MKKVAIIGSGLAATSAAKILISKGMKPTIIDKGDIIDRETESLVKKMSSMDVLDWELDDINFVTSNSTVHEKNEFPKKLAFGSDYFYAKKTQYQKIEDDGIELPVSYAKGGFSVGWGASVLVPDDKDIESWPIGNKDLKQYYETILSNTPYSASKDDLSKVFPLCSNNYEPINMTSGNKDILYDLNESLSNVKDVVVGQSRLLVRAKSKSPVVGCQYCGYCMSGCVYNCIYKSSQEIDELIEKNQINYISNMIVHSVEENRSRVNVRCRDMKSEKDENLQFDKVLIAAGAVNSTRIILQSKKIYNKEIKLLSTTGFVVPVFRFKKFNLDWPSSNTQPGIFLEYKANDISSNWAHTQLSTPNEMVFSKLGINANGNSVYQRFKKVILSHLYIAHVNLHSDQANGYFMSLKKEKKNSLDETYILQSRREDSKIAKYTTKKYVRKLFGILKKTGSYVLIPFMKVNYKSPGYHVGGTMPMKIVPENELDTNLMGNPKGWNNIHVIDSSIFPTLPGTTIGLLAMANASRIADNLKLTDGE